MSMSCGLIGVPGAGKTTIYNAITAAGAGSFDGGEMNRAMVEVPDPRVPPLVVLYEPKKIIQASLEVVDIPGLAKGSTADEGRGTKLLGHVKGVDALLHVVRCFDDHTIPFAYETIDPARDVETIDLELVVADTQTLQNKINRLARKAKVGDKDALRELDHCQKVLHHLEEGLPVRRQGLGPEELAAVYECHLISQKPVLYVANLASPAEAENGHVAKLRELAAAEGSEVVTVCGRDEADIAQLPPDDRPEFLAALGLQASSMERLIRAGYRLLGLCNFFTAGEKEVHVWTCRQGDPAPVAAGKIHSDMEKGFIRMEVIRYEDLVALKSEQAVIKAGKQRVEGRTYLVQDGDIVVIRFNR
ncbi:MAG: redox-regulated ATPase YchF [Deltaproteobacteria bacterium RIFOXYA12_FULL_61_11]|nr:MAG: redox-regulated ATPase YchF [Deltaproteobacteria bacterium RIFOXYA12_FULL_61_11]